MQADFVLDYNVIAVERPQHLYLLARIQAEAPPEGSRRPLNLGVVLDRSGSMQGDKLAYVQQAARFLVQRLGADDRLALVSYNQIVSVDAPGGPVVEKDRLISAIMGLRAGGTTNLSGGWLQGAQLVAEAQAEGQVNRVLLLTDGLANEGVTDAVRLEAMARQKRAEGITTTTLGVGLNFNEDLLTRMAAEGGGAFYFIDDPDQAPTIFAEELEDLLSVVGQNLTVSVTLSPDVRMVRQLNDYPQTEGDGATVFRLGDLFADELKTLLLELSIPALATLGEVEVARLRFEYDELTDDAAIHRTIELPIVVNTVPADDFDADARDEAVTRQALLLQATRAREEAVRLADQRDFKRASEVLSDTAKLMEDSGLDDDDLRRRHDMLREEAVDMEFGDQRYDNYYRKTVTTKIAYDARASSRREGHTAAIHVRQKASRRAIERGGPTPTTLAWYGGSIPLAHGLTIGRSDDNDVVLDHDDVSAHHCLIERSGDDFLLRDLDSTNGTYANGGLLEGSFRLSDGDVISVGTRLLTLSGAAAHQPPPETQPAPGSDAPTQPDLAAGDDGADNRPPDDDTGGNDDA